MALESAISIYTIDNVPSVASIGKVNVSGKSVSWVSGDKFKSIWERREITIDGESYIVVSVTDAENLTIDTDIGTKTDKDYSVSRVYAIAAPQTVDKPYIVFTAISKNFSHSMGGDDGLCRTRVQFSVWGNGYESVKGVVEELRSAYRNYIEGDSSEKMGMDEEGDGGHWVQTTLLDNEVDRYEDDTRLYNSVLDVLFWHRED